MKKSKLIHKKKKEKKINKNPRDKRIVLTFIARFYRRVRGERGDNGNFYFLSAHAAVNLLTIKKRQVRV
jgi:hypothetical protein